MIKRLLKNDFNKIILIKIELNLKLIKIELKINVYIKSKIKFI